MILLIGTLENVRLREGGRVVVSLGPGEYAAEVVDSSDQSNIPLLYINADSVHKGAQ